jgi:hypothetical protein
MIKRQRGPAAPAPRPSAPVAVPAAATSVAGPATLRNALRNDSAGPATTTGRADYQPAGLAVRGCLR